MDSSAVQNPDAAQEPLLVALSADEALVLFELLARSDEAQLLGGIEPAEERVLWRVEAQLQKALVSPFREEYRTILAAARVRILASSGEPGPPAP